MRLMPCYVALCYSMMCHVTFHIILWTVCVNGRFHVSTLFVRERSGSVVECLTRDRRAAGSSLTGVTALWFLSKTHLS